MKALIALICSVFVFTSSACAGQRVVFALNYTNIDSRPVIMVFDPVTKNVSVEMKSTKLIEFDKPDKDTFQILKKEVLRLTSTTNTVALSDGYSIKFTGGHPIWMTHTSNHKDGIYLVLTFSVDASMPDKTIVAKGSAEKPAGQDSR